MYYFATRTMDQKLTGIEQAILKRLKLFKKHNVDSKIMTTIYNPRLHSNITNYELKDNDIVNVYDFIQDSQSFNGSVVRLNDLPLPKNSRLIHTNGVTDVRVDSKRVMSITCFPGTENQVNEVTYYDRFKNTVQKDVYDSRGFLSLIKYYDQNGSVCNEEFYSPEGKLKLHLSYKSVNNNITVTSFRVVNYKNSDYDFDSQAQLTSFVFDELNNSGNDGFISDRDVAAAESLVIMKTPAKKFLFFHNIMTPKVEDLNDGPIWGTHQYDLDHLDSFEAIAVSTKTQAEHIIKRFNPIKPVVSIPAGYAEPNDIHVSMSKRKKNSIICVARIDNQKRLDHLVEITNLIHQSIPDIQVNVYGVVRDNNLANRLNARIKDLQIENVIHLARYTEDIDVVYDDTQLMLSTSRYEGFNMSLLEGQNHGIPVISYDIPYGPSEIIEDQKSGYLVENGRQKEMADLAIGLLQNDKKLQEFSNAAYESAQRFSENNVWKLWDNEIVNH